MIIRTIAEIENTERDVFCPKGSFRSLRIALECDNLGYSVHKTIVNKGGPYHWHYKNHIESCYCISGRCRIKNLETNEEFDVFPDTIYILDKHDNHEVTALEKTVLISVFNPAITGQETHEKDGSYLIIKNNRC